VKLRIATCQFPVSADVRANARHVSRQMRRARDRGAHVAHFCEGALSGYAGADFTSFEGFDWDLLARCSEGILDLARRLRLWVLLGSSHRLSRHHKPHNSVYVIDDRGRLVDRYDKRFCAGDRLGRTGDLSHYSPGNHFAAFTLRGIRCGVLICHDYRYPELVRGYKRRGVQLIFHSYHAGNASPERLELMRRQVGAEFHRLNRGTTLPEITMPAAMQAAAASSHVWISCSNTSARESCWPSFFVRPDGVITGRLRSNAAGILLSTLDTGQRIYDSTVAWRDRAMRGVLHSGRLVRDARSESRTQL
jgi:predicted amidohydrolase